MRKKRPIWKIFLIILIGLYLLHYFIVPLSVIDKEKAINYYNEQVAEENKITSLDLQQMIPAASASNENEGAVNTVPSCKIHTYMTPFNLVRQYFSLDRFCKRLTGFGTDASAVLLVNEIKNNGNTGILQLPHNSKTVRVLLLLSFLLCLAAILFLILTRRTGYAVAMAAGVFTALVHLFSSVGIFRLEGIVGKLQEVEWWSNAELGTFVKMLDCVSMQKWYVILLIIPNAILVFSIIGFAVSARTADVSDAMVDYQVDGMMDNPNDPRHYTDIPLAGMPTVNPDFDKYVSAEIGKIVCLSGDYQGAVFKMQDGEILRIGRDPGICNIVLSDMAVARISCEITYNMPLSCYTVNNYDGNSIDQSGTRIPCDRPVFMRSGDEIRILTTKGVCCFRLE